MTPQDPAVVEDENLDAYFEPIEDKESKSDKYIRNIERSGTRVGERLLGAPGDIIDLVRSLSDSLPDKQKKEDLNFVQRGGQKVLEMFPTSEEFQARSAELRPDLEPQSEGEELSDEWVGDISSLAVGGAGMLKSIAMSTFGSLGKEGMKSAGYEEGAQEAVKTGLMVFTGMFGKGRGVKSHINNLYKESRSAVPKGDIFKYPTKKLDRVEKILKMGSMDDAKSGAMQIVDDIKTKTINGSMDVLEGIQFDKDINRAISKAGKDSTKSGYLKQVKAAHSEAMDVYAKDNPTWGDSWKEAKQAYAGIATAENIKGYVRGKINLKDISNAGIILGIEEAAIPGNKLLKLGSVGTGAAMLYAKEIGKRLTKNPALRRYYGNVVKASLSDNKGMLARNLKGLERVAKKEFEENPLPVFDIEDDGDE